MKYLCLQKNRQGFTLIELLVVVAIISLLSSIVMASLNTARAKARDAQRTSDMRQLQTAFELFYHDKGLYPPNPGGGALCSTCIEGANNGNWQGGNSMSPYLSQIPIDPRYGGTTTGYRYRVSDVNGRQSYTMIVRLEKNTTWCSISTIPGHTLWNGNSSDGGGTNYPLCVFN